MPQVSEQKSAHKNGLVSTIETRPFFRDPERLIPLLSVSSLIASPPVSPFLVVLVSPGSTDIGCVDAGGSLTSPSPVCVLGGVGAELTSIVYCLLRGVWMDSSVLFRTSK
jgi:hypothetical protein